jgi:membrane associated rhomboid family serine protease
VSRRPQGRRIDSSQLRITPGALFLLVLQLGTSLVWLMSSVSVRGSMEEWLVATSDSVWREGKVWTLVTSVILENSLAGLIISSLMLWMFVPALERWWGRKRFLVFALATSVAGTILGTLCGLLTDTPAPIVGYDPFIIACTIAFGILYARQPVQLFGVVPMTGRQLMIGMSAFVALFILLGRQWEIGASYLGAMSVGALLASGRWNPRLWWYKWRHNRVRRKLEVLDGGRARGRGRPGTDENLLN